MVKFKNVSSFTIMMGSFERNIAMAKLTSVEKYKSATMEDLNLIRQDLGAEVIISADRKRATVIYSGVTTDVSLRF